MCGPDKGAFYAYSYVKHTHIHTHTHIYTQYMYNRALYKYIDICTYIHPRWKKLHLLCSWSDYRTGLTYVWQRVWSAHNPNIILRTSCSNAYKRHWSVRRNGEDKRSPLNIRRFRVDHYPGFGYEDFNIL